MLEKGRGAEEEELNSINGQGCLNARTSITASFYEAGMHLCIASLTYQWDPLQLFGLHYWTRKSPLSYP